MDHDVNLADPDRTLEPLWRGLVGYRVLAWCYAAALVAGSYPDYLRPRAAMAELLALAGWTLLTSLVYLRVGPPGGAAARIGVGRAAVADAVVTVAAVASTALVETPTRISDGAPMLASVWSAGPVVALALAWGVIPGVLGALAVQAAVLLVRGRLGTDETTDLLLMLAAAVALGYAAGALRSSADRLRQAAELRAGLAERERLARSIHDGVLQVLAQVRRRGADAEGEAGQLAELAGEQEVALRTLLTTAPPDPDRPGELDLAARLGALATTRIGVALPGGPVGVPRHLGEELVAAVVCALDNVRAHVGPEAPAWVLLERLPDQVVISIRDDGPGIAQGRLDAARIEGRLGVSGGIQGRLAELGGTARCRATPGQGCEWTLEAPVADPATGTPARSGPAATRHPTGTPTAEPAGTPAGSG